MTMRGARLRLAAFLAAATWLSSTLAASGSAETMPPPVGQPAPNFALTTQQSDRLWLAQLRGRAVVLAFGCTKCGACGDLVSRLDEIARGLGDAPGRRVVFALVTVDPLRDTPTVLREYARAHGLRAPAWALFTEERAGEVDVVARRYGVEIRRAGDRVEADCTVTLIDAAGVIRSRYGLESIAALSRDLSALLP